MKRFFAVSSVVLLALVSFAVAQERRFTIDDLLKVRRVGDPQVSPKGDLVAFTITDVDKVVHRWPTRIHPHRIVLERMEELHLLGQSIVKAQGHLAR